MILIDGLPADETARLNALVKQVKAKQPRNELRTALMNHKRTFENWPLVSEMGELKAVLGWCAKGVETLARRCRLEGFTLSGGQDLSAYDLDVLLDDTQFLRRSGMGELNSLVHSVAFEVATTSSDPAEPDVLITHVSALNGSGTWNGRLGRLDDFLSVQSWKASGDPEEWALYLPGRTWVYENGTLDLQEHSLTDRVPVEPLIYKPRLERPFGQSRITRSAIFLTRSAARVIVRSESTADLYSAPGLLALGLTADQIADGSWRAGIGNVIGIPDAEEGPAEAPQLARVAIQTIQQASQEPHVAQLRAWAQLFSGEMSIPVSSLGIGVDSNPTSAESYAASREDLIAEAEDANGEWDGSHRHSLLNAFALREGIGFDELPAELRGLRAKRRDPRHTSQAAAADAFVKVASVIPGLAETDTALDMLGLDPSLVERLKSDLRRGRSSAMVTALAGAAGETPAEPSVAQSATEDAAVLKAKFEALGMAVRAGVDPEDAAGRLGLAGIKLTGGIPVSLRMPQDEASSLEER